MKMNALVFVLSVSLPALGWGDWSANDAPGAAVTPQPQNNHVAKPQQRNAVPQPKNHHVARPAAAPVQRGVTIDPRRDAQVDTKASAIELALGLKNSKRPTIGKSPAEQKAIIKKEITRERVRQPRPNVAIDDDLTFALGSDQLTPAAEKSVAALAKVWAGNRQHIKALRIDGHTDARGSDSDNMKLSIARANTVRNKLIAKGVPASIIVAKGHGEAKLLPGVSGNNGLNRQVEYSVSK